VTITVNPLPVITVAPSAPSIFPLGSVSLTASGANTYSWSPATGLSATTGASVTASPAATTTYKVIGTSAAGCVDSVSVTVTVTAGLDGGAIAASQTICKGTAPAALTSTTAATGGSGTYTYQWQSSTDNVNFTDISGATSAGYAPGDLTATTYYRRRVSDAVTTALSNTVTITVSEAVKPTLTAAGATSFCAGGSVVLNASAATTYTWYRNGTVITGATAQSYTATQAGRYVVIGTNADNCKSDSSAAVTVLVNDPPAAPAGISGDTVVIARYPYTYTATPSAGATSYIWTLPSGWSGTSTTNTINATSGTNSGVISVVAVANGCNSTATTLRVTVKYDKVTIPDVITPNGDGFNDKWKILRPNGMKVSVAIFNRWGQQVYKNEDYRNDWDGVGTGGFLGKNLPNGTYFFVVELSGAGINGKDVKKGSLTLKRD
jgi:gliding motility-associated-like protein